MTIVRRTHNIFLISLIFFLIYCNVVVCFHAARLERRNRIQSIQLCSTSEDTKPRKYRSITLPRSGKTASVISRTVPITEDVSLTVWEWENPAQVVESYWEAAQHLNDNVIVQSKSRLLDPFGIVSWPGSVIASQELYKHREVAVEKQSILILGAGVGLEAQASALFGAKEVLATDIHPTTLQQLRFGVEQEEAISDKTIVETKILDLFAHEDQPIPTCDTMIIADVLYNELLASQVALRIVEAWLLNPKIHILVTDSQRFVPTFVQELNELLESAGGPSVEWEEQTLKSFTGSGVCIDDDQTYDIIVRKMWMGL